MRLTVIAIRSPLLLGIYPNCHVGQCPPTIHLISTILVSDPKRCGRFLYFVTSFEWVYASLWKHFDVLNSNCIIPYIITLYFSNLIHSLYDAESLPLSSYKLIKWGSGRMSLYAVIPPGEKKKPTQHYTVDIQIVNLWLLRSWRLFSWAVLKISLVTPLLIEV